jgi:hypothetical protein
MILSRRASKKNEKGARHSERSQKCQCFNVMRRNIHEHLQAKMPGKAHEYCAFEIAVR